MDAANLYRALTVKTGFEVVRETPSERQLRVVGRLPKNQINFWLPVVAGLLEASDNPAVGWTVDVSKQYRLAPDGLRYGWRLIFQARTRITEHYSEIIHTINKAPRPSRVELESIPLPGYRPGDSRPELTAGGKGAAPGGSAPLIIRRKTSA